ncbi:3241_t:CDS:10 [Paraglomus brasilianum]|uniref:3241_t:CDS:1 n=1 Tax=Paraglomus brasilianum TaxID=144538 RepID=A0A9N9H252_9GLOM|nr:3241_t:CDS:10 [Paraglomus brasilianum]
MEGTTKSRNNETFQRPEFPKTLEGFGYHFTEEGELRNIETNDRFVFVIREGDRAYNQAHYEALGDVIAQHIEDSLVTKYNFTRQPVPIEAADDPTIPHSWIYLSPNSSKCKKLMLLIQGSGAVRPGQWARQVIINDSLKMGSMFPYIEKAQEQDFGIIIFNPNVNFSSSIERRRIEGSATPPGHCLYVWKNFVRPAKAEDIVIVAHSYGGICTAHLIMELGDEFCSRVKAIALTDSVHSKSWIREAMRPWFSRTAINWITSSMPLDTSIPEAMEYNGCPCLSAGHKKHEYTSGTAFPAVFKFINNALTKPASKPSDYSLKSESTLLDTVSTSLSQMLSSTASVVKSLFSLNWLQNTSQTQTSNNQPPPGEPTAKPEQDKEDG